MQNYAIFSTADGGQRNSLIRKELRRQNSAFTLVELLVVIAIIGMLMTTVFACMPFDTTSAGTC